ncbi:hypothetical protein LNKW23_04230 [Paralimibaculum aggregatum]|uniref:Uncharacterized protein n=1 Tax=Paralimibaculum aggregatum TaxID=3036245 RepID=A0ABQ6LCX1_9RHOB|nr:hypothetical protein [Limibaculum sp. NKW23]GMG81211.1 hypothetical protein LNKW23_04230 [Limibaculum sp. NKW23]
MEMPAPVRRFERLFLGSLLLGLVLAVLDWDRLTAGLAPRETTVSVATLLAIVAVVVGLVLLASRRRSSIARWVVTVMVILGMLGTVPTVLDDFRHAAAIGLLSLAQAAMQLWAVWLLHVPAAKPWYARGA